MKALFKVVIGAAIIMNFASVDLFAARKTTGTPLGGMGAGYIVYNAATAAFAKGYRLTGQHWYQETAFSAAFHLYTKSNGVVQTFIGMKSENEDAYIPIYRVHYTPATNGIDANLLAFGPYVTGDEKSSVMPLAFFEFTIQNTNAVATEAGIALQIVDLAGANPTRLATLNGVSWSGTDNATVMASSDLTTASITTGSAAADFLASGALANTDGNIVAVKATLEPNQIGHFRFVVGWYQEFSGKDWSGTMRNEGFYYQNYVTNSTEAATYGMTDFVRIRDGAVSFVDRIRAVNLPDWYTDRILNDLYPLTHNSQFAKDGRVAWREGKYYIIGTIDQQGHSQLATSYNWPAGQWRQMEYWARTQWQGADSGEIHHDFNGPNSVSEKIDAMCTWDDYSHNDYWFSKTKNWSDLNGLYIINSYELFLATADITELTKIWPALKRTGGKLVRQATLCIDNSPSNPPPPISGFVLPWNCLGSYDREGSTNEYNGSIALNAYACLKEMALAMGDAAESKKWDSIWTLGKTQFSQAYSSKSDFGNITEGQCGTYSWSRYLGLPVIMSDAEALAGFNNFWDTKSGNGTNLQGWHFYTVNHAGDMGIALGLVDKGLKIHKADYDQFCVLQPQYYFWQDLDALYGAYSYMTAPVVWRSLMLITGYCLDKYNKRLWLRPMLPTENNGILTNAPLINPGNWGTMNYTETEKGKTQQIYVKFDSTVEIKEICLKNPNDTNATIMVLGSTGQQVPCTASKSGTGLDEITKISFASPISITSAGIHIGVNAVVHAKFSLTAQGIQRPLVQPRFKNNKIIIDFALDKARNVTFDIVSIMGAKIATLSLGVQEKGVHSISSGRVSNGMYIVRLRSGNSVLSTSPALLVH